MMKLLCGENFLEYSGGGWFQCGRHVNCPKIEKDRNKVLGFDCLIYIDNLPDGCKINISEQEPMDDNQIKIEVVTAQDVNRDHIFANKSKHAIHIIPANEQIVPGLK